MKCKSCGAEMGDGYEVCPYCGAAVEKPKPVTEVQPTSNEPIVQAPKVEANQYYNPYAIGEHAETEKSAKRNAKKRHTALIAGWIFLVIGAIMFLFAIISMAATQSIVNSNNAGAIINFIFFGWIFMLAGGLGGTVICLLCEFVAIICAIIDVCKFKARSVYSWIMLGITIALFIATLSYAISTNLFIAGLK